MTLAPSGSPIRFADFIPTERIFTGQAAAIALSQDGALVAYSSDVSGQLNLWLHDVGTGERRQLTHYTDLAVRTIRFAPDGRTLAFTADRDGDEQYRVYLVDVAGGEPALLTPGPAAQRWLTGFDRDGGTVYYSGNDRVAEVSDAVGRRVGGRSDRGDAGGEVRYESEPGLALIPWSVSPDGRWLLLSGASGNTKEDCYLVDRSDPAARPRQVTSHDGDATHSPGPWSPDSGGFFVRTNAGREFTALGYYSLASGALELVEAPDWDVEAVTASGDGTTLAWVVNEGSYSVLHVRRDGEPVAVPPVPPGVITGPELSGDGAVLAFVLRRGTRPADVAVVDLRAGEFRYLTDSRPPATRTNPPAEPRLVSFPSRTGTEIPALLYRPETDRPCPVVLAIHGGPESQERPEYRYSGLYPYLLAAGIGVLAPNVRGSTGYGLSYQKAIHRDWGGVDLGDFDDAARFLLAQDWVRADRIGVFGRSYGGFATLSCLSRLPGRWAAGVSFVGPSNLVTLAESVPPTWRAQIAAWVGDPEADAEFLTARSPLSHADAITAPLFVIQGARDPRVNKAESDQIVASLRARGVSVRYDVYPDEGHAFTRRDNETKVWTDIGAFLVAQLTG